MEAEDLFKALGAFFMCFGQGLPKELKAKIQQQAYSLASEIDRNGEPNVARLARALADQLSGRFLEPPSH
jgi:hypothetical protein